MTRLPAAALPTTFCGPLEEEDDEAVDFQGVETGVCGGVKMEFAPYKLSLAALALANAC